MFCFLYKLRISQARDSNQTVPGAVRKHMDQCARCRGFYQFSKCLEQQLVQDAPVAQEAYGDYLREKILRTLPDPRQRTLSPHSRRRIVWRSTWAAAAILLILLLGLTIISPAPPEPQPKVSAHPIPSLAALIEEIWAVNASENQTITDWPGWIEKPIIQELDSLASDTENITRFLLACISMDVNNPLEEVKNNNTAIN